MILIGINLALSVYVIYKLAYFQLNSERMPGRSEKVAQVFLAGSVLASIFGDVVYAYGFVEADSAYGLGRVFKDACWKIAALIFLDVYLCKHEDPCTPPPTTPGLRQ